MTKHFLIMNPGSRDNKSRKYFRKIFLAMENAGLEYKYEFTKSLEDAFNLSRGAIEKGFDVIVAVGGDGTINNVLNGFYNNEGKLRSDKKMAVIYTGTSPDFCKSYNIPLDLNEAVDILKMGNYKEICIGKITLSESNNCSLDGASRTNNGQTVKYFACCANIGLGATLARKANSGIRKYFGDFTGTLICLLQTIFTYRANDFIMLRDNEKVIVSKMYNMSVGKTKFIASGIKVEHDLGPDDNKFYTLIVRNMNLVNILNILKKVYRGKRFSNNNNVSLNYCERIEVYNNIRNPEIEFDGDPAGYLPCFIEPAQDKLKLIVNESKG